MMKVCCIIITARSLPASTPLRYAEILDAARMAAVVADYLTEHNAGRCGEVWGRKCGNQARPAMWGLTTTLYTFHTVQPPRSRSSWSSSNTPSSMWPGVKGRLIVMHEPI